MDVPRASAVLVGWGLQQLHLSAATVLHPFGGPWGGAASTPELVVIQKKLAAIKVVDMTLELAGLDGNNIISMASFDLDLLLS